MNVIEFVIHVWDQCLPKPCADENTKNLIKMDLAKTHDLSTCFSKSFLFAVVSWLVTVSATVTQCSRALIILLDVLQVGLT